MSDNTLRRSLLPITVGALLVAGCAVAQEPWPNLTDAEAQLRGALGSLLCTPDRSGGHKTQAARLVHAALDEIGMAKRSFR
jgi:hypothetical protein